MKWLGVVGTREVNEVIRRDIEMCVGQKIAAGYGIVSGGATGTDHQAARLAYAAGLDAERFRIFLPVELRIYCQALLTRAAAGKCNPDDAKETIELLEKIARERPGVIFDKTDFATVDERSFHARNLQIVDLADELVAFRVAHSRGTTFTAEQAKQAGLAVTIFDHTLL